MELERLVNGKFRLNTLHGVVFLTGVSNFKKIQDFLRSVGFVNSDTWPIEKKAEMGELFDDVLIYEEEGIGLYRCSFHRQYIGGHPLFEFKYWERRLTPEQKSRDPMKPIVLEIYRMLKPVKVTSYNFDEFDLDIEI